MSSLRLYAAEDSPCIIEWLRAPVPDDAEASAGDADDVHPQSLVPIVASILVRIHPSIPAGVAMGTVSETIL